MRFKNLGKNKSKHHLLVVSCAKCKTPQVLYHKGGNGGLIKMQVHLIKESEMSLNQAVQNGQMKCSHCDNILAKFGNYKGRPSFWVIRGQINTKWLNK